MLMTMSSGRSCGVTTTALMVALAWPREILLVEADPSGGSIATGYLAGLNRIERSLLELATQHRRASADIDPQELIAAAEPLSDTARFLHGIQGPGQSKYVNAVHAPLSRACRHLSSSVGIDVLVDLGRYTAEAGEWISGADLNLVLTGTSLTDLAVTQSAATAIESTSRAPVQVVMIGEGEPYSSREVQEVLELPVLSVIERNERIASNFSLGSAAPQKVKAKDLNASALMDSVHRCVGQLMEFSATSERTSNV